MNFGVQRFHPAVHHLRETGVVGDIAHGNAGIAQQAGRAAGREDVKATLDKRAGEGLHSALVGNAD